MMDTDTVEPMTTMLNDQKDHKNKSSYVVTMSNALAKASYRLGLDEKRLVALAISRIDSRKPPSLNPIVIKVHADEFQKTYNIQQKNAYLQLREAGRKLVRSVITAIEGEGKNEIITEVTWLTKARYKEGEGWIELAFNDELAPHLMGLKERFASHRLEQTKALRKSYSWRLVELMMAHKTAGKFEYTPDELKKIIGAPQGYPVAELKRRILTPAQREISKNSEWVLHINYQKTGRKIGLIQFDFHKQKQQSFFD